jgi:thioredoxin-dependent peroxiredoxin
MTTIPFPYSPSLAPVARPLGPAAGDPARDVLVHDATGRVQHLADLWMDVPRALVLVFLRQYGCPLCREQVAGLARQADALRREGIAIAAVGQGTAAEAARFREQMRLPFPVVADPTRSAYAAWGVMDGTLEQVFSVAPGLRLVRAMLKGHLPHRTVGSVRQLPGAFVIDRNGIVQLAYPAADAADMPDAGTLLGRIVADVPLATPA